MDSEITKSYSMEAVQKSKDDVFDKVSEELKKAVLVESDPLPSITPVVKGK